MSKDGECPKCGSRDIVGFNIISTVDQVYSDIQAFKCFKCETVWENWYERKLVKQRVLTTLYESEDEN